MYYIKNTLTLRKGIYMQKAGLGILVLLPFILVFSGCGQIIASSANLQPEYEVHISTPNEEANELYYTIYWYKHWVDLGYSPTLPDNPVINSLRDKALAGGSFTDTDKANVVQVVRDELYNESDYQQTYAAVMNVLPTANEQVLSLLRYKEKWGFVMPHKYMVKLSFYTFASGGTYSANEEGVLGIHAYENETRRPDQILATLYHETIHYGIDRIISKEYDIPNWTNERIVDQFVYLHFKVTPTQWYSFFVDRSIDVIFREPDVLDHLPTRVREFLGR